MKKNKIGLVTCGRWHKEPYYLLKKKFKVFVFDKNKNNFLKKNIKNIIYKSTSKIKNYDFFFWSPVNDVGSALADRENFINKRKNVRSLINLDGKYDKLKIKKIS